MESTTDAPRNGIEKKDMIIAKMVEVEAKVMDPFWGTMYHQR